MRLPETAGDPPRIDRERATRLIHSAVERGVNFVDTAWSYHRGECEPFLGQLMAAGLRDQVHLSTKLPSWLIREPADHERYLGEQLRHLRTDHFDFYLLHGLTRGRWRRLLSLGICEFLEHARDRGTIVHIGFSFHDGFEAFREILTGFDWECCLLQYNLLNEDFQAGRSGVRLAAEQGLDVMVMEPLLGGRLTSTIPEEVRRLWQKAPVQRSPAEWALRWVFDQPEVGLVLSGMSSMDHVEENIRVAELATRPALTAAEAELITQVRDAYQARFSCLCTQCGYCLPCPEGVAIPTVLDLANSATAFGELRASQRVYNNALPGPKRADSCNQCGSCEESCPQGIPIIERLREAHELLATADLRRCASR